jgi:Mor transcription activator family
VTEFYRIFGPEPTEKILTIFGGATLRIPSTKDLRRAQRDISIYDFLRTSKNPLERRRRIRFLRKEFLLTGQKIRSIERQMARLHDDAQKLRNQDAAVSQHQRISVKLTKRKRHWRM